MGNLLPWCRAQLSLVTWVPCYSYTISTGHTGVLLHYRNVTVCHDPRFPNFFSAKRKKGKEKKERGRLMSIWCGVIEECGSF